MNGNVAADTDRVAPVVVVDTAVLDRTVQVCGWYVLQVELEANAEPGTIAIAIAITITIRFIYFPPTIVRLSVPRSMDGQRYIMYPRSSYTTIRL